MLRTNRSRRRRRSRSRFAPEINRNRAADARRPVRSEALPTPARRAVACSGQALSVALCLEQIVLVVVVVLVLDLLRRSTVTARLTPAARFGQKLYLPPLDALSRAQGRR